MFILKEAEPIGKYAVQYLIKQGGFTSTYRVEADGVPYFVKLFDPALVPPKLMREEGVTEIVLGRKIRHENVVSYVEDGVLERDGVKYPYLVTEFFRGRLLSEYLREGAGTTTSPPGTSSLTRWRRGSSFPGLSISGT